MLICLPDHTAGVIRLLNFPGEARVTELNTWCAEVKGWDLVWPVDAWQPFHQQNQNTRLMPGFQWVFGLHYSEIHTVPSAWSNEANNSVYGPCGSKRGLHQDICIWAQSRHNEISSNLKGRQCFCHSDTQCITALITQLASKPKKETSWEIFKDPSTQKCVLLVLLLLDIWLNKDWCLCHVWH